jgi:hypothetical protein
MIMAMCTAPAMMPAPTMKVMPAKIRGTCATHIPVQHQAWEVGTPSAPFLQFCWIKEAYAVV